MKFSLLITKVKSSLTLIFSYIVVILGVVEVNMEYLKDYLGDKYGLVFVLVGIVSAILRLKTTKSLEEK